MMEAKGACTAKNGIYGVKRYNRAQKTTIEYTNIFPNIFLKLFEQQKEEGIREHVFVISSSY